MRIAIFHNYYALRGGEDVVFELECEALMAAGHEVFPFTIHNETVFSRSTALDKAMIAWRAPHNQTSYQSILDFLKVVRPDIGHVHNWFPVISPAVYTAHNSLGIPVVQTLHNYRLGCASGTFRRNGKNCNLCTVKNNRAAVSNRCYRGSLVGSIAWKRMIDQGWKNDTFTTAVSHYISPSREVADRHIAMGIPPERISIIPNACEDPFEERGTLPPKALPGSVVFIGRMVAEKGVDTLLEAWKLMKQSNPDSDSWTLTLIGGGPELENYTAQSSGDPSIHFTGQLPRKEALEKVLTASISVSPSKWAEPFGLGVIESMAAEKAVIASNLGGPSEIITHDEDGLLIEPGSAIELADSLECLLKDSKRTVQLGRAARQKYGAIYQPSAHAHSLIGLFESLNESRIAV